MSNNTRVTITRVETPHEVPAGRSRFLEAERIMVARGKWDDMLPVWDRMPGTLTPNGTDHPVKREDTGLSEVVYYWTVS